MSILFEQTGPEAALLALSGLIGHRLDIAFENEVASVKAQLLDMQIRSLDYEHAADGRKNDLTLVKAFDILNSRYGQPPPALKYQVVGLLGLLIFFFVCHNKHPFHVICTSIFVPLRKYAGLG